jgi:atypical dual specificity phosphatase
MADPPTHVDDRTDASPESPPVVSRSARMSTMIAWRFMARVLFLPTLCWNVLLGRLIRVRNWWDPVDDQVLMGGLPFVWDVAALKREGVIGVVNMCAEYRGPRAAYRRAGIVQLHLPTIDFTPPTLEQVEQGVAFIEEQIARGGRVYVHCKAGRARSGTVVLCWLIVARGLSPAEAQQRILARRPHAHPRLMRRAVVQAFAGKHRLADAAGPAQDAPGP